MHLLEIVCRNLHSQIECRGMAWDEMRRHDIFMISVTKLKSNVFKNVQGVKESCNYPQQLNYIIEIPPASILLFLSIINYYTFTCAS